MALLPVDEIYQNYIRDLPRTQRLKLLTLVAQDLEDPDPPAVHSIMELHGLGKEIWEGIDPQAYVDQLRAEWDLTT